MANTIRVKGAGKDRKIVLWETDPAHPNGEVVVSNDGEVHVVGETAEVKRLIGEGRLVSATTQAAPVSRQQTPPVNPQAADNAPPFEGYDELNVTEALEKLSARRSDRAFVARALAYERAHKNRTTVVEALVGWNG